MGSNFQYTLALEKRIHCLKSEWIGKKAPLGNLPWDSFLRKTAVFGKIWRTLPKAQRNRGLSSALIKVSYWVISQVQTQILIKLHLRILTKHLLKNLIQTPNSQTFEPMPPLWFRLCLPKPAEPSPEECPRWETIRQERYHASMWQLPIFRTKARIS